MSDLLLKPGTRAYSYIRFSSKKQRDGDSLRRQREAVEKFVSTHSLQLDPLTYRDLGVSAWKGKNATEGALALFLKAVEDGVVPRGSLLLIEALDRLSRQDLDDALLLFISIINKGITIVTLSDGFVYSKEAIKNSGALYLSIAYLAGANRESENKSKRLLAVNEAKRKAGTVRLNNLPAWLTHKDGKVLVREERAAVIRWMFERAIAGDGSPMIAKKLNRGTDVPQELLHGSSVPTFAAEYWSSSNVAAYLKNVAVTGTLHQKRKVHEPVLNHYPVIVEQEVFDRARAQITSRLMKGGRKGVRFANLFAGMTFCECGSKMRIVSNSDYIRCLRSFNSADCDAPRAPIKPIENVILKHFNAQRRNVYGYTELESEDLSVALRDQHAAQSKRVGNLLEMVAELGFTPASREKMRSEQAKLDELTKALNNYVPPPSALEAADEVIRAKYAAEEEDATDLPERRLRLQTAVRRILEKVVVRKDTHFMKNARKTRFRKVEVTFSRSGAVRSFNYVTVAELAGREPNGQLKAGNKIGSQQKA